MIAPDDYFTFMPLLHEVATGMLCESDVRFPLSSFISSKRFEIIKSRARRLDPALKLIELDDGRNLNYELVVIASGARPRLDLVSGSENSICLKTIEDAKVIRDNISALIKNGKKHFEINVVGGGFTGLELVCEIDQMLDRSGVSSKVRIFERGAAPLSEADPKLAAYVERRLKRSEIDLHAHALVDRIDESAVICGPQSFYSDMTVLAAGVIPNTDFIDAAYLDDRKNIIVTPFLNLSAHSEIFALGDIISIKDQGKPAMLAQLATQQASMVAKNISAYCAGKKLLPYTPKVIGLLISLGTWDAVGRIFGWPIYGRLAWYIWRTVYLFKTPGLGNRLKIAWRWTIYLFKKRKYIPHS